MKVRLTPRTTSRLTGQKSLCVLLRNQKKHFLLVNRLVFPGLTACSKSLYVKSLCAFFLPDSFMVFRHYSTTIARLRPQSGLERGSWELLPVGGMQDTILTEMVAILIFGELYLPLRLQCNSNSSIPTIRSATNRAQKHVDSKTTRLHLPCNSTWPGWELDLHLPLRCNS